MPLTTNHRAIEHQIAQGGAFIRCPWCHAKNRDDGEYIRGRNPGEPLCCDAFTEALSEILTQVEDGQAKYPGRVRMAADMIEAKNLLYVEGQVRKMLRDTASASKSGIRAELRDQILYCPYCRLGNRFGNPELCCMDLGEAVAGVLVKLEIERQKEAAERIAENADKLRECGVTVQ